MSTRCSITCLGETGAYSIYRHCDGYPEGEHGVLATIAKAFPLAWPRGRFESCEFAASLVAAWKDAPGYVRLSAGAGAHGDTEYHYDIRGTKTGVSVQVWAFDDNRNHVRGDLIQIANTWAASPVTVRKVLELSTAHLTPGTRDYLSRCADNQNTFLLTGDSSPYILPCSFGATESGWYVSTQVDDSEKLAFDLEECIEFAKLANCTGILFDRDSQCSDGLPVYGDS